jgi:glyoxylase-like metal-dependent hydrolase (beta-lactamase superfamily II)
MRKIYVESTPLRITRNTYCIGGPNITDPDDCFIYLVNLDGHLILIDAGIGRSTDRLLTNISQLGLNPQNIALLVLTHEHVDHIGGAVPLQSRLKFKIAAHEKALPVISKGDSIASAAKSYGVSLTPTPIDITLTNDAGSVPIGDGSLHYLHTPGHTPGSIVLYFNDGDRRVLFGQDLHGPFNKAWGSNIKQWRTSMKLVLALEADILCEGHYGVYRGKSAVRQFIFGLLEQTR